MVSDMLRQYFLNNLSLTVILPRSFRGTPARMMVKCGVDCCFGCQAMEDGNPMVALAGVAWWLVCSFGLSGIYVNRATLNLIHELK